MPEKPAQLDEAGLAYVAMARSSAERLGVRESGPDASRDALADLEDVLPLDADPPATSAGMAAGVAKSAVKRLVRWYFAYLAAQVTAVGEATLRLGSQLADRIDDVEDAAKAQSASIEDLDRRLARLEAPSRDPL